MSKRIEWIDIIKYICIMFVMLSHLESETNVLKTFFSPFFLTLFLFSSGYVHNNNVGFKSFLIKKIRGLFFPWLIFSTLNIFLSYIISFNVHNNIIEELCRNYMQIRGLGDGMWFVAALFIAFIPFYFVIKLYEKVKNNRYKSLLIVIISLLMLIGGRIYSLYFPSNLFPWGTNDLPWHIDYIPEAMFFMLLGYIFKSNIEFYFNQKNNWQLFFITLVSYLSIIYLPIILKVNMTCIFSICYEFISQLCGCVTIISFTKLIKTNKYFSYIGQNTIICFAFHGKIISLGQTIFKKLLSKLYIHILNNVIFSSVFAICFTVGMSIILILPIYLINKWFPWLLGRPKRTSTKNDIK